MAYDMDLRDTSETALSDYSDFGEEFERLMAMEIADAARAPADSEPEITLLDAIDAMKSNSEIAQPEYTPEEIGRLPGYSRTSAIRSAETFAMASVGRKPTADRINSRLIGPLIHQIALCSDNQYGRSTIGAERYAEGMGCSERQCRSLIIQEVHDGILGIEVRPGKTPALWLRYPRAIITASALQIFEAIAPPRRSPGRPASIEKPRNLLVPGNNSLSSDKPRKSYVPGNNSDHQKTPEVVTENPGSEIDKPRHHSASDYKNSLQDLNARKVSEVSVANDGSHEPEHTFLVVDEVKPTKRKSRANGMRQWEWIKPDERRELFEKCKLYADERGWSAEFLARRLKAFNLQQKKRPIPCADWWAALELWLDNPNYQPGKTNRSSSRFSPLDLLDDANEDGGWR